MSRTRRLLERLRGKTRRTLSMKLARRTVVMRNEVPLVSFTFDDFPCSALAEGGAILQNHGLTGTFFASFGLMGRFAPTGKIFSWNDLRQLVEQQHELGCHTYDHCHAWDTACSEFEASIIRNQEALQSLLPDKSFRTFSYPISYPRPETKRRMLKYFECCRGGGQTFNTGSLDLNCVEACFLEQTKNDLDFVATLIELNNQQNGWLIFATHDISPHPTEFGCTPTFFKRVVRRAAESGATILPVCEALDKIHGNKRLRPPSRQGGSNVQRTGVNFADIN